MIMGLSLIAMQIEKGHINIINIISQHPIMFRHKHDIQKRKM